MNIPNDIADPAAQKNLEEPLAKKSPATAFDPKLIDQLVGQAREQGLAIDGETGS